MSFLGSHGCHWMTKCLAMEFSTLSVCSKVLPYLLSIWLLHRPLPSAFVNCCWKMLRTTISVAGMTWDGLVLSLVFSCAPVWGQNEVWGKWPFFSFLGNETHPCTDPWAPWEAPCGGQHDPSTWTSGGTTRITFRLPRSGWVGSSVGNGLSAAGKTLQSLSAVVWVMAMQQKVWNATTRKITRLLGITFVAGSCDSPCWFEMVLSNNGSRGITTYPSIL